MAPSRLSVPVGDNTLVKMGFRESQCNCQSLVAGIIVANVGLLGPFDSFLKVKVS